MTRARRAILAGTWYPAEPERLRHDVRRYLAGADPAARPAGRPVVAVVPHAGYVYSGPTAGRAYGLLEGLSYDRVVLLAPSHRAPIDRVSLPAADAFRTPLGEVPVDRDAAAALAAGEDFAVDDEAHAAEHAIEIQLPFLQLVLGAGLRILPLLVPHLAAPRRRRAAAALAPWCDGRSLLVVSTDLTHYGRNYGYVPFRDRIPERLRELDGGALDLILARDAEGLVAYGERTGITMCGLEAAALALAAPLPAGAGSLLDYRRSGDRDGDYGLSVSYAAVLLTAAGGERAGRGEGAAAAEEAGTAAAQGPAEGTEAGGASAAGAPAPLSASERRLLLDLARAVVEAVARGRTPPEARSWCRRQGREPTPRLLAGGGDFVTLQHEGRLRGCIGVIEPAQPLLEAVARNAFAAACRDPRFRALSARELPGLELEISVLTPPRPVAGPEQIEVGRHGILLHKGAARSVFLPQVAVEQGWDLPTTLSHLALKAGLPPDAWRRGTRFQVFEAEILPEQPQEEA